MEWIYDPRARCWRLMVGGWEARVERWPASLEYTAEVSARALEGKVIRAPHVFGDYAAAQAWCIQTIMGQSEESPSSDTTGSFG